MIQISVSQVFVFVLNKAYLLFNKQSTRSSHIHPTGIFDRLHSHSLVQRLSSVHPQGNEDLRSSIELTVMKPFRWDIVLTTNIYVS